MKALIIIAHGSRSAAANDEVHRLADEIDTQSNKAYDQVVHAYLEIAEPRIDDTLTALAGGGATAITVFPYFLAGGTHVAKDIPACIRKAEQRYPHIRFKTLPHLGALAGIPDLILRYIHGTDADEQD